MAVIFFMLSTIQAILVICPPKWDIMALAWATAIIPTPAWLLLPITLVTDFAVKSSIANAEDVETVQVQGSFWL